jgi:hypothetical protein
MLGDENKAFGLIRVIRLVSLIIGYHFDEGRGVSRIWRGKYHYTIFARLLAQIVFRPHKQHYITNIIAKLASCQVPLVNHDIAIITTQPSKSY